MSVHRVFISRTGLLGRVPVDQSYAHAAIDIVNRVGFAVSDMSLFTAEDSRPADVCEDAVRECTVYVGIFGLDYGSPVRDRQEISYTELEFLTAIEDRESRGMQVLVFLQNEATAPDELGSMDDRQRAFRARVCNDYGLTACFYDDRADLAVKLLDALHKIKTAKRVYKPPRFEQLPPLPKTTTFKGRDADLKVLNDAWDDPKINVLTIKAWGGVGKSALLGAWLAEMYKDNYRGARAVYGYNFEGTAGDFFIEDSLARFGDPNPTAGTIEEKGERLAALVRKERALLVLDGFQALQTEDGDEGAIISPAVRALVTALASNNSGLCVIASRQAVTDIAEHAGAKAPVHPLAHLEPEAGAEVLKALGVTGPPDELRAASAEVDGHALTLNLLGAFLAARWLGDVTKRDRLNLHGVGGEPGKQAQRVMESYEELLAKSRPDALALLRVVSLFYRPAKVDAQEALFRGGPIPELTDGLGKLREEDRNALVVELRKYRLLLDAPQGDSRVLDLHPLVREYFSQKVLENYPAAYRLVHEKLARHFARMKPDLPTTTTLMAPLYQAVVHGCQAGLHNEALDTVYWPRIKQGEEAFNTKKLGAFVADLTVLGQFFANRWDRLHDSVGVASQARLLYEAAFDLRALGRAEESLSPMRACLAVHVRRDEYEAAAKTAGDLSLLCITLGRLGDAMKAAKYAVRHADQARCPFERVRQRSNYVHALVQVGKLDEALRAFWEAEAFANNPGLVPGPGGRLPTLQSYWFYELHLERRDFGKVNELVALPPRNTSFTGTPHLDRALTDLALARARMCEAATGTPVTEALLADAERLLASALKSMGKAGTKHHRPRVLLACAALHRQKKNWKEAESNLNEAGEIARQCRMDTHLADYFLEVARFYIARGTPRAALDFYHQAEDVIARTDYQRRNGELAELGTALADYE